MSVFRCYSEKKPGFDVEAQGLCHQLREQLGVASLESVRILNRYDADHIDPAVYQAAKTVVFSEPQVDDIWDETYPAPDTVHSVLAVEALPGQLTSGPTLRPVHPAPVRRGPAPSSPTPRSTSWAASCPRTNWRRSASTLSTRWRAARPLWTSPPPWSGSTPPPTAWLWWRASPPWTRRGWPIFCLSWAWRWIWMT